MDTIFSRLLATQNTNEVEVGKKLNQNAGTIGFRLDDIEWDNNDREYNIFSIPTNWGNLNLVKNNTNNLVFTMIINQIGTFTTTSFVGGFQKGSRHHLVITWSIKDKEIKLYLDGKLFSTTQIINNK